MENERKERAIREEKYRIETERRALERERKRIEYERWYSSLTTSEREAEDRRIEEEKNVRNVRRKSVDCAMRKKKENAKNNV